MQLKNLYISILGICLFCVLPLSAKAESNPFLNNGKGSNFNDQVSTWTQNINDIAPTISFLFSAVFTIMFLAGVVRMGYSIVTKTGQVMKGSTGLLIWVPISFFFLRLLIIFIFTTSSKNVTLLASDIISLVKVTSYYTSIGMILIGLVLFMFYRFIDHPEYGRWGKRLWVSAAALSVLATIMPLVLGAVK
jgi:hypothetical protein